MKREKRKYDLAVFIGRMQPLHNGHVRNIKQALEIADHALVIAGSANQPRTPRNPFTANERTEMVKKVFPTDRVRVEGVEDFYPDTRWLQNIQATVHKHIYHIGLTHDDDVKIAILGHDKDHTSYYLKQFPTWEFVEIGQFLRNHVEADKIIAATDIRERYFTGNDGFEFIRPLVPTEVFNFLNKFSDGSEYKTLRDEYEYIKRYAKEWSGSPYPVTFVTTDAVVVQSGHVLLVKRRTEPGKGLWALPGGFVNQTERLEDGVIRELREETKLKVPVPVLKGSIKGREVFDEPGRSLRGRTITNAFLFDLADQPKLPKVKGADDAEEARWFPLDIVDEMSSVLFEDHKAIIHTMVAKLTD